MKKLLLLLAAAIVAVSVSAAPVNLATATSKAHSFLTKELYAGKSMAPAAVKPVLLKAEIGNVVTNQPVYYIFNTSTTFIVVAGDDRADEILMVGDAPLTSVDNLPPGMQDMLGQYKDQIMYLQENPSMEANLLADPSRQANKASVTGTYGPLLTCNWDQEAPYYNQCKFGSYQCLTGCPATSASMVFYFWKYPTAATPAVPGYKSTISYSSYGSTSYTHSKLASTTFDWANMLDSYSGSYTTAQGNAVATLMHYVGQAERMGYGTSSAGGSGVSVDSVCNIRDAFIFFGYDSSTTRFVKKTSKYSGGTTLYSDSEWASMIQEEMAAGRPIVFCAVSSNAGGHAFNVDGYNSSTNKYHINFGWSGSGNAWCSLNAFGYSSYNFNVYQQMVIGIKPPTTTATPTLSVSPASLSFSATAGETVSKTFTVTGTNLTGSVSLSKSDANGVYTISPSTITASAAASGATVTVTYKPTAAGTHTGTITVASSGATSKTVSLSGTAQAATLETYTPVMSAANSSYITSTSFRANWTDQTPSANVASYTLQVDKQGSSTPTTSQLASIDLSNVTAVTNSNGYLSNVSSNITSYLGSGWSASTYVYANTGMLITKGNFVSPTYSLSGYSKVTVKVKAASYYSSYYGSATLKVATGSANKTQALSDTQTEYTFVLNCSTSDKVTISSTSNYIAVSSIEIYAGDITSLNASETGGTTTRTITGITNKYYTVSNLEKSGTFNYKVKAIYTDGTSSAWSNIQSVTLSEDVAATPTLTVSQSSLSMSATLGNKATATFKVTGADLTNNVTLSLSDANGVYSITPTSITAANAANGVNVTVTYNPAAAGTHSATITVASTGATSKTVSLAGTATIQKATPVANAATGITSTGFTANWTHNVAAAGVSSYTLYANLISQPSGDDPEPQSTLLASLDGSQYTGSYRNITLTSPWGGSNVKGGNGAVYTKNSTSWWGSSSTYGTITYTVPSGYSNATFTVQITTANNSYGSGNITVKSAKTSAVGHSFAKAETYSWTVTASAGDKITIYSTSSNYSPDMTLINIYAGTLNLNATVTGDNTALTVTGIAAGQTSYALSNLIAGATYSYYVVANYVDGTKATSNTQEVVLTSMGVNNGGTTAIDAIMNDSEIDSVTYVNMAGAQSSEPFEGINIKVVRYKNGTMKSTKILY
ncbi:MAG: C10 family peptidase [Muribaculaceae bacterium]|nr:C10 family peptidase [Muribaculaceae bacterium]